MKSCYFSSPILVLFLNIFCFAPMQSAELPNDWLQRWNVPTAQDRPLQIIHGWFGDRTTPEKLRYFKDDCGLGGLVVNVSGNNYLRNEEEWKRLVDVVRSAKEIGLRIWIYDEDGYPSLMAGGVVLDGHPELECKALVYDASKEGDAAFSVRTAYEHTHAANKWATLRRMPNPLDSKASQRFIEVTHQEYKKRLGELHDYVEAYFTDEPSMNAVNMPLLPEHVRVKIKAADPVDPNVSRLPMIPWSDELEKELAKDGKPINKISLFTGDSDFDRAERQRFWEAIARLYARFYHQAIQDWCHANGVASSGHLLGEESLLGHTPFDGNKMRMMRLYDIPGLDQLNSWPKVIHYVGWKTLGFPASAAALNGTRLIMTEISDHSQRNAAENPKPASLDWMKASAAGEAAWGVTEFTLYYQIKDRGEAGHKDYCDYVGRLNAILRDAKPQYSALLYYPTVELQQEYLPTADPLMLDAQSKRMQDAIKSFDRLGQMLVHHQIPFIFVDEKGLKDWIERMDRKDWPLLIPKTVAIPDSVNNSGAKLLIDSDSEPMNIEKIRLALDPKQERFEPANPWQVFGKFQRDGRTIYVVSNTDDKQYEGKLVVGEEKSWFRFDPESGKIEALPKTNTIPLSLKSNESLILVGD